MHSIEYSPADVLISVYRQGTSLFVSYKFRSCKKPKVDFVSKNCRFGGDQSDVILQRQLLVERAVNQVGELEFIRW